MRVSVVRVALATMLALISAGTASAQAAGLPVINSGIVNGVGLALDVGIPNDAAGGGWATGATVKAGFGVLGVSGTVSRLDPSDADAVWSGGATANMKVFGGPLIPIAVTLQGGAGYVSTDFGCLPGDTDCDITQWHFPVGLGVSFTIPNPALAIKPWIAPRLDVLRTSVGDSGSETDAGIGISGGVELNLLNGMGFHVAYDWSKHDDIKPGIFAAGFHYTFRVPGL
jgi:opacity protein-like surface antigen